MSDLLPSLKQLVIASDHAGFEFKEKLKKVLAEISRVPVVDMGPISEESVDYPDFAIKVCGNVSGNDFENVGILICGSGQGMAMTANKFANIRAALCWNEESAKLARAHNNANVLCLGARLVDHELCMRIAKVFLSTPFEGGRHQRRVEKIRAGETQQRK